MRRRTVPAILLALLPWAAHAQAPGAGRMPQLPPAAQPRDDSRFSAEVLKQMASKEADVQGRLSTFPNLRLIRGQVSDRQSTPLLTELTGTFAKPGWNRPTLEEPHGRDVWAAADGWTGGKQAFAWVYLLSNHKENGLVPYTIITNMPE